MPSSTSNSKLSQWDRAIPDHDWKKITILSVAFFIVLIFAWEAFVRYKGYAPSLDDNKDLWSYNREKVNSNPKGTVLIGASRMLFNFDLSIYKEMFGHEPIQLATVGTNATYYLDDIANNSEFSGTLIMDVLPLLMFVPEGMPVEIPTSNVKYFKEWTLSQEASFYIGLVPDRLFAFLEPGDLSLNGLMAEIPLTNRIGAKLPPKLPPYFLEIHELNRQGLMTNKTEIDKDFARLIQARWTPLFTPPPPPSIFTPEQFKKIFMDHMNATLLKMTANIAKIKSRGGKVILTRFPGSHTVLELENKYSPDEAFWNRIKTETGASLAVSFQDHPELQGFELPEWSHLSRKSATEYTKRLLGIMQNQGAL